MVQPRVKLSHNVFLKVVVLTMIDAGEGDFDSDKYINHDNIWLVLTGCKMTN